MIINSEYVKRLREKLNLSQEDFANLLGVSRGTINNYEKGKVIPESKYEILMKLESNAGLIASEPQSDYTPSPKPLKQEVRQVSEQDFMVADYLPIEAQAGYLDGLETQHLPELGHMLIPREFEKGNYLVVELSGDSMNDGSERALKDGDKLLVKELHPDHWRNKLHYKQYLFVIMSREGIVCKQITAHDVDKKTVICHSFNELYEDYTVNLEDVYKLFYVKKIVERRIRF